jgi:hypothetical protein
VDALLTMSPCWAHIKVLKVMMNMRLVHVDLWGEERQGCHDFA